MDDLISRQAMLDGIDKLIKIHFDRTVVLYKARKVAEDLPSAQPFHIITMTDVMKYIDDMPEDVWLEFTECLGCRGWELQRRTAKWCGGDFA